MRYRRRRRWRSLCRGGRGRGVCGKIIADPENAGDARFVLNKVIGANANAATGA